LAKKLNRSPNHSAGLESRSGWLFVAAISTQINGTRKYSMPSAITPCASFASGCPNRRAFALAWRSVSAVMGVLPGGG
jgi:hypothetical protein